MKQLLSIIIFVSALFAPSFLSAQSWRVEPSGSFIRFTASSRFGDAQGIFRNWEFVGAIDSEFRVKGELRVNVVSIDTGITRRDNHLRGEDFFDTTNHPIAVFVFSESQAVPGGFRVRGDLQIRGKHNQIELTLLKSEAEKGILLKGSFIVPRNQFGVSYQSSMNPIADDVKVELEILLTRAGP